VLWDNPADPAARVADVAIMTGDEMQVYVPDRLPASSPDVHPKVAPVGIWLQRNSEVQDGDLFLAGAGEPVRDVSSRGDQRVSGGDGVQVEKRDGELVLRTERTLVRHSAERTGLLRGIDIVHR
jgi:hypothetical protein